MWMGYLLIQPSTRTDTHTHPKRLTIALETKTIPVSSNKQATVIRKKAENFGYKVAKCFENTNKSHSLLIFYTRNVFQIFFWFWFWYFFPKESRLRPRGGRLPQHPPKWHRKHHRRTPGGARAPNGLREPLRAEPALDRGQTMVAVTTSPTHHPTLLHRFVTCLYSFIRPTLPLRQLL